MQRYQRNVRTAYVYQKCLCGKLAPDVPESWSYGLVNCLGLDMLKGQWNSYSTPTCSLIYIIILAVHISAL